MSGRVYILVEGTVDAVFVAKLLESHFEFERVRFRDELGVWENFQARFKFPIEKNGRLAISDLGIRSPEYYRSRSGSSILICLRIGNGDQVWQDLDFDLKLLERDSLPDVLAIVGDADDSEPVGRFEDWKKRLGAIKIRNGEQSLAAPESLGTLSAVGEPRVGLFLFPDAAGKGTFEDLLAELGRSAYPGLYAKAEGFVGAIADSDLPSLRDSREFSKFAGRKKAVVGAMTAILKPGFATPRTIKEDGWLEPENIRTTPRIASCVQFLTQVLGHVGHFPS